MRSSHVAATIAAVSVGLTAAAALHRRTVTRRPAAPATAGTAATPATTTATTVTAVPDREGVVLPFVRPVAATPAPVRPAAPARCGDSGGVTKAGTPCGARAAADGRCHHHRLAA
jgi:hypothetical protein